jgi:2-methylcitrate dehydratase PrpD
MKNLTESLCSVLTSLPRERVTANGARLVRQVWSQFPKTGNRSLPNVKTAAGSLRATAFPSGMLPIEAAAFNNAFLFAEHWAGKGSEWCSLAAPVFSATALAEGRGTTCEVLSYAVGLGVEAHSRVRRSLGTSAERKSVDCSALAATLGAIVACGTIERLPPQELSQALGLGSSAITAVASGYSPLQAATAARDGIVMVGLMCAGFIGPPDPLACRWGVYEVFADSACAQALDVDPQSDRAGEDLQRLLGAVGDGPWQAAASTPVTLYLAELGLTGQ